MSVHPERILGMGSQGWYPMGFFGRKQPAHVRCTGSVTVVDEGFVYELELHDVFETGFAAVTSGEIEIKNVFHGKLQINGIGEPISFLSSVNRVDRLGTGMYRVTFQFIWTDVDSLRRFLDCISPSENG